MVTNGGYATDENETVCGDEADVATFAAKAEFSARNGGNIK